MTVLDIYCGSMSLAGSTRMQATSSEQLLGSCALEAALVRMMPRFAKETAKDYTVAFEKLLAGLESPGGRAGLVKAIEFEKGVFEKHGRITYLADKCMLDLFTDNTERSPTFMLPPYARPRTPAAVETGCFATLMRYTAPGPETSSFAPCATEDKSSRTVCRIVSRLTAPPLAAGHESSRN